MLRTFKVAFSFWICILPIFLFWSCQRSDSKVGASLKYGHSSLELVQRHRLVISSLVWMHHSLFCLGDYVLSSPSLVQTGLWYRTTWKMNVLWELLHKKWNSPLLGRLGSRNPAQDHPSGHTLFSWDERSWNAIYCKTHSGHSAPTVNDIPFITTQMRTEMTLESSELPRRAEKVITFSMHHIS